jgi:hypothetical protein
MGLLQGSRLIPWTTKSPIRANHWVPLGCRAPLGSVKWWFEPDKSSKSLIVLYYSDLGGRWDVYFLSEVVAQI